VAERGVLEGELGAILDGEFEQLNQDAEVRHPLIVTDSRLDAQGSSC
jgi:hypothetical protein